MGDVVTNFLQPIARQFPLPKGAATDPEAWQRDYIEALETHTDSLLGLAAKKLIKTRESRSFPLVAECVRSCLETLEALAEPDLKKPVDLANDEWSEERRKMADSLINCELGRQAVKDGWAWGLWDWIRQNERLPNGREVDFIRSRSIANNKQFAEITKKPAKPVNPHFYIDIRSYIEWKEAADKRFRDLILR